MGEFGQFHSYKDEPGSVNSVIISFSLFFFKKKIFPHLCFLSCTIETCCTTSIPKTCESLGTMLASVSRLQQMHNFSFFNLVKIHLKPSIWKGYLESVAQISDDKFKVVGNTSVKR